MKRVLGLMLLLACAAPGELQAPVGHLQPEELSELSGLAPCRRLPGFFWGINDSGNPAQLFAINSQGESAGPPVMVDEASNVDWEAIASAPDGRLFIGDVGDNQSARAFRTVYVLNEPDPRQGGHVKPLGSWRVRFPDQQPGVLEHDCEAMFWRDGTLWFLTKQRGRDNQAAPLTRLYRLENPLRETLTLVDQHADMGGYVTDAALSPDGSQLAVLTLSKIDEARAWVWVFELPPSGSKLLSYGRRGVCLQGLKQAESITYLDAQRILVANEQRELFVVPAAKLADSQ